MISVSFYLLTPEAVSQSQVYVSISNKRKRLRFTTGYSFLTSYCNIRKKKGGKDLIKKNTAFYFEYNSKLNEIRDSLIRIEMDLANKGQFTLDQIRDIYYSRIGKLKDEILVTYVEAFEKFIEASQSDWTEGTKKHFITLKNHLTEFEKIFGKIRLEDLNEDF